MKTIFFLFVLSVVLTQSSLAKDPEKQNKINQDSSKIHKDINDVFDTESPFKEMTGGQPVLPSGVLLAQFDEVTRKSYLASLRAYYDYRSIGYTHRQNVFRWQLLSSKIIFFVVVFLVIGGMYFSGVQFHKSLKVKDGEIVPVATNVEASLQGIKVSSPVLGVIILVFSLLFFYLYLVHVYPISEIF